jgi:hypothetical protein
MNRTQAFWLLAFLGPGLALVLTCRPAPRLPAVDVPGLRSAARERLAREEVADGRRPLLEAAALLRELDRVEPALDPPRPDLGPPLSVPFPASTEAEAYCLQVARWAYLVLQDESPDRAAEVVARLAAEVREEARTRGAVRLPDPATLEPVELVLARAKAEAGQPTRGGDRAACPPGGRVLPGIHRRRPRSESDGGSGDRQAVRLLRGHA